MAHGQVFEGHQSFEVHGDLGQAPPAGLPQFLARKTGGGLRPVLLASPLLQIPDVAEKPTRLRWYFVERTTEDFRGQFVRQSDIVESRLDVAGGASTHGSFGQGAPVPLVLANQLNSTAPNRSASAPERKAIDAAAVSP